VFLSESKSGDDLFFRLSLFSFPNLLIKYVRPFFFSLYRKEEGDASLPPSLGKNLPPPVLGLYLFLPPEEERSSIPRLLFLLPPFPGQAEKGSVLWEEIGPSFFFFPFLS